MLSINNLKVQLRKQFFHSLKKIDTNNSLTEVPDLYIENTIQIAIKEVLNKWRDTTCSWIWTHNMQHGNSPQTDLCIQCNTQ